LSGEFKNVFDNETKDFSADKKVDVNANSYFVFEK